MKTKVIRDLKLILALVILAQLLFAFLSPAFTEPHYVSRIYATTGVKHRSEDLHKLNEAAHYFGQTIIGWLKFPNFMNHLMEAVPLPEGSTLSAHIQERQNIIFTLNTPVAIENGRLEMMRNYLQSLLDEYNAVSQTEFVFTNLDYEQVTLQKSYAFGAFVSLLASIVIGLGLVFIRREFH